MTNEFKSGVKFGLIIYGVGAIATSIVHFSVGWDYPHAPPASAVTILLTLVFGAFRLIKTLFSLLTEKSIRAQGELLVHMSVAVVLFLFFWWLSFQES